MRASGATCVFCGREIGHDEPVAGRGPMAAHASCADAALADDAHWDAISEARGGDQAEPAASAEDGERAGTTPRTGCLALAGLGLLGMLLGALLAAS